MSWECPHCNSNNENDTVRCACGFDNAEIGNSLSTGKVSDSVSMPGKTENKITRGWGWLILFALLASGVPKIHMNHEAFALLSLLSVFAALYIYFKLRKKFISEQDEKASKLSAGFKAGALTYLICLVFVVVLGILDKVMPGNSSAERSKAASVTVMTTLNDREGLTEKDFDFDMLKQNEKAIVDTCMQQGRQYFASRGNDASKFNPYPVSESHFATFPHKKLGIVSITIYPNKEDSNAIISAVRIIGFTSKGIETVNCVKAGADIPLSTVECIDKIKSVFGVNQLR